MSNYKFEIGKKYEMQNGDVFTVIKRHGSKGYESVEDENGCNRYDRSTGGKDYGRVTGTNHDYSHPKNAKRDELGRLVKRS